MSGMERSPRRTPVRRARTSAPANPAAASTTGGGLFANVESDDPGLPLPGMPFSSASQSKGLDSGLAKACPSTDNLNQKSYRSFRRRLELFQRQCSRRGREVAVEGTFLIISRLKDVAWDATEHLSFDEVERASDPFKLLFKLLDELYQYEDLIEVPSRCDEFFSEFYRLKGEEMQAYIIRHRNLLKRMSEVSVDIPPLLSGWHLLTRAGVPRWTHVQIKSMCAGDLEYEKVAKALVRMFGGDHKPNARDFGRVQQANNKDDVLYEEDDSEWYEEFEEGYAAEEWYEDEAFEYGEIEDDEIPEELEEAMELTDEAYVSYIESRKRMKELALSRGFYPVVALGPDFEKGSQRSPKGEGKSGKGKGKSGFGKGKGKGKSKGGGNFMRRTPFNRRPMSGLRKSPMSSTSTTGGSERSTLTGSTAQHGPRFKRYRSQGQGVKEVPEEVTMVEDIEEIGHEEELKLDEHCFFAAMEKGKVIVDSGATRTIVGEENWHRWLEHYGSEQTQPVTSRAIVRQFKFGGGEVLQSQYEVTFTAVVHGQCLPVTASVVPGATPFLLARPTLEEWGVVHDYKKGLMKIGESEWFRPERNERGHFILDLMMYQNANMSEETFIQTEEVEDDGNEADDPSNVWFIEPLMETEATVFMNEEISKVPEDESLMADQVAEDVIARLKKKRILKFFEVYVDQGNLAVYLAKNYSDVEVSTFSLPEWDFERKEVREEFVELLREVSPEFVWLAPPCRKWSAMQRLTRRNAEQLTEWKKELNQEEDSHLALVADSATVSKENENDYAMEHPHGAGSWNTPTLQSMRGYFEAVCNRCRTGLYFKDKDDDGPVRKQTRIRTSSLKVAEALDLACHCTRPHVQMEGRTKGLQKMQNYEDGFVRRAGKAIYESMCEAWRKKEIAKIIAGEIMVAEEMKEEKETMEVTKEEVSDSKTHSKKALSVVEKLHRQLGHPGRDRLVHAVKQAGLCDEVIQCAKSYKCSTCQNFQAKKLPKPASLAQTTSFNEMLEMDTFHVKWDDKRCRVLAIIDLFSRYEMNRVIDAETEKEELKVLDDWIHAFGCPARIRTDASGAHMSEQFLSYMDDHNIKLTLVPKEAHHRMGTVERLHAVRRLQLLKMKQENPKLQLELAAPLACSLRNKLRSIHGVSPSQIVFGRDHRDTGLADEPLTNRADGTPDHQQLQKLRLSAATSFYEANHSQTLRKALLSKSRGEDQIFYPGDWVYYWRSGDGKLEPSRWRGPALVCSMTPRDGSGDVPRPSVYWIAHGSALIRVAPEHLRPEAPRETQARLLHLPSTARVADVQSTVRRVLQPVRGPIRFLDLSGDPPFAIATDTPPGEQPADGEDAAKDDVEKVTAEAIKDEEPMDSGTATADTQQPQPHEPQQKQVVERQSAAAEASAQTPPSPRDEGEKKREHPEEGVEERPSKMEKPSEEKPEIEPEPSRGRSRSPMSRDDRSLAFQSYNMSRQLDGLPPVRQEDPAFERFMDTIEPLDEEELLMAETFQESKLNPEQREAFSKAKDAALMVWIENAAWKAVPESEAGEGEVVPARFLQRWKPTSEGPKPNARVILQGFKHKDVLTENLQRESPTLSRHGRITLMVWAVHRKWKLWCADVKSAFMQSDSIDDTTRIYVRPPGEMRRRLERLMGLRSHEILKATKPAFGDVRAPRQWNETADRYLTQELGLVHHPLDRCLYLSIRAASADDPEFLQFEKDKGWWIVDGALGLHVDDFLGAGEQVFSLQDVQHDPAGAFDCFQHRLHQLSKRFRFGSWDFGDKMRFCGSEVQQSEDLEVISVSLQEYVNKIKPLTLEKARKTMVEDMCTEKEHRQLRALVGAMSWPVTQCVPQAAATISLLQAHINKPAVKDMLEANKCLRFLKEAVKTYVFKIRRHGELQDLRLGVYCDAAWSVRPDGSSQGGMMMFIADRAELESHKPFPLTVIDWASKKLVRMCRSSLSAEAQSATIAVDELEWAKVFYAAMVNPFVAIHEDKTMHWFQESPIITDAKALFDSTLSVTPGMKLSERRTAIEICILKERLHAVMGNFRWVNSTQQLADGFTKTSARESLAYTLSRGVHALRFDPQLRCSQESHSE